MLLDLLRRLASSHTILVASRFSRADGGVEWMFVASSSTDWDLIVNVRVSGATAAHPCINTALEGSLRAFSIHAVPCYPTRWLVCLLSHM